MAKYNIHTVRNPDGGWSKKVEGNPHPISRHRTQAKAIEAGRQAAKQMHVEHLIHGRHGQIRERNSYGGDPYPPRG